MDNENRVFRQLQENAIQNDRCKFIYQVHLLPRLKEEMSSTGSMLLPAEVRETLEALITDNQKRLCSGQGLKSVGYDAHYLPFRLTLTYEDNVYKLIAPWRDLFERVDIRAFSAISIWVRQRMEAPLFYVRLDGYANEGEPLPPLPNMPNMDG